MDTEQQHAHYYTSEEISALSSCTLCPRECGADRFSGGDGYCGTDAGLNIASVCIHRGEEPPVSGPHGICNIFFAACNLQCIYCQNHDISRPGSGCRQAGMGYEEALDIIGNILSGGIKAVGFVSPSHVVPQVKAIIRGLRKRGFSPVTVYNTNGYDKLETLRSLGDYIDVWLPDFKYVNPEIALSFSDAYDYPEVALRALKEMYFQKGSSLHLDESGMAERGILIRHLVLPGLAEESRRVLRTIASELSPGLSISLMSQYHPVPAVIGHETLGKGITAEEYRSVVEEMERLGFRNGWIQDPDSSGNYLPDFSKGHPFE